MAREFPDVEFIDTNTDNIFADMQANYETEYGRQLSSADPMRLMLLWMASIISQERSLINLAAKRNLPRYAEDEYLDSVAELFNTTRIEETNATCTVRFYVDSTAPNGTYTVPAETEVTDEDGVVMFSTIEDVSVEKTDEATETNPAYVDAVCECEISGTDGNGYEVGRLTVITDSLPYFSSCTNTTASYGGADEEDDESFYNRLKISNEEYSSAVTLPGFKAKVEEYGNGIRDVTVTVDKEEHMVIVYANFDGNLVPSKAELVDLQNYLGLPENHAMTDEIMVTPPTKYAIEAGTIEYYIPAERKADADSIQEQVEAQIVAWKGWQEHIGRDIDLDKLIYMMMSVGAIRITVSFPDITTNYVVIPETKIPIISGYTSTYKGVIDNV